MIGKWMALSEMGIAMQTHRHYSRAPITEAIIDFRVALPEGFLADEFADLYSQIKDDFPIMQPFQTSMVTLDPGKPDSPIKVGTSEQASGFLFRSRDNLRTFQATSGGFTFNRLAPYKSWEEFSAEAQKLWEIYKKRCKPICVTRAAIRYVNQINIPSDGAVELKEYLKTVPEVSSTLSQNALQSFFMQLQIPQQDLNCLLLINEAIAPRTNPNLVIIILDLDLFREQIWASDDDDIWQFLELLRHRENEVFESSITDKTRELIS